MSHFITYMTRTRDLLQLPGTNSTSLYSDSDLLSFINISRGQIAGEGECIRQIATIQTVIGQQVYRFQDLNTGNPGVNGVQGIINIQSMACAIGTGQLYMTPRAWPWFNLYKLNNAAPKQGRPTEWTQYGQGTAPSETGQANGGTFYVAKIPDDVYTLNCNSTCYPIPLVDENSVEALPYFWSDAVPFFAAYFALMSAQTNARMADAATMYKGHYNEFMTRARQQANPSINRPIYAQAGDPAQAPKMGISKGAGQ